MQARDFFDDPKAETPRAPSPEPRAEMPAAVPAAAPVLAASAVVFHAVSEHDAAVEDAHKPVRRRRHGQDSPAAPAEPALQMVETQLDAPSAQPAQDDEPPRRSRPRRRRSGQGAAEPLMLVETQGGSEGTHPDNQP